MKTTKYLVGAGLAVIALAASPLNAAIVTWGGSSGEYTTAANWIGGSLPNTNGGDTALINAGNVTYTPGGDLAIHNGGTLQIAGGSYTQAGSIAYIQMTGGNILVTGGTYSQGTAGAIVRDATSSISVTGGVANFNDNIVYDPSSTGAFSVSGTGRINVANEFKPIADFTLSSGTLSANLMSFADGPGKFTLSGGLLMLNGTAFSNGIYPGANGLVFSSLSSGGVFFSGLTDTTLTATNMLTDGRITVTGGTGTLADYILTNGGGGVTVTLAAVPEPSTYALLALGMGGLFFLRRKARSQA